LTGRRKLALLVVATLALAVGAVGLVVRADPSSPQTEPSARPRAARPPAPEIVLVRRRDGVPASWAARLLRTPGVEIVARTARTQVLLRRSNRAGGATVDVTPPGYAIPLDAWAVQTAPLARMLPEARAELHRLRPGAVLLSRTSARVRRLGVGDSLTLADGQKLRVAGVLPDDLAGLAEVVVSRRQARDVPAATQQLLVSTTQPGRIARRLPRDDATRVRRVAASRGSAPTLIARPLEIKARFGEFAVRLPYGTDWIRVEPGWLRRHVVTRSVPILGAVTCNRRLFGPLRGAMRALERRGLSHVVDRGDYAGCYAARRIPGSGSLSLHAWGLAIDLNAAANPRLGSSRQDRGLVRAMEGAGFIWGGRWPTAPDPMHFELHTAPPSR
jgi:D-alanyl-D-alanine carboxypeptidase-like protein/MacB-like protein